MFHVKHPPALHRFAELLLRWNRTVNLIARRDEAVLWERHIEDSLQLVPLLPAGLTRAIDLGSGAGFPALVLAIATGVRFELIEADQRKAAFLSEAARETGAPVVVHAGRIEATDVPPAMLVTARALAPLPRLLTLAAPKLAPGGICLFLKGAGVGSELTAARAEWHMRVEQTPSRTSGDGSILRISEVARIDANRDGQPG